MKINFPRIVKPFNLSDYAPELTQALSVWVNPPRSFLARLGYFDGKLDDPGKVDEFNEAVCSWFSELLSQGDPSTHITPEDLKTLRDETKETDPGFWLWFQNSIAGMIRDHRITVKKN